MVAMGQRSRAPMGQRSRVCLLSLKLLPMKARDVTMMARPARAQIKGMKDRDLARLWAQYVRELAVLLVRAEGGGPHPRGRRARAGTRSPRAAAAVHQVRAHSLHVSNAEQSPSPCLVEVHAAVLVAAPRNGCHVASARAAGLARLCRARVLVNGGPSQSSTRGSFCRLTLGSKSGDVGSAGSCVTSSPVGCLLPLLNVKGLLPPAWAASREG